MYAISSYQSKKIELEKAMADTESRIENMMREKQRQDLIDRAKDSQIARRLQVKLERIQDAKRDIDGLWFLVIEEAEQRLKEATRILDTIGIKEDHEDYQDTRTLVINSKTELEKVTNESVQWDLSYSKTVLSIQYHINLSQKVFSDALMSGYEKIQREIAVRRSIQIEAESLQIYHQTDCWGELNSRKEIEDVQAEVSDLLQECEESAYRIEELIREDFEGQFIETRIPIQEFCLKELDTALNIAIGRLGRFDSLCQALEQDSLQCKLELDFIKSQSDALIVFIEEIRQMRDIEANRVRFLTESQFMDMADSDLKEIYELVMNTKDEAGQHHRDPFLIKLEKVIADIADDPHYDSVKSLSASLSQMY